MCAREALIVPAQQAIVIASDHDDVHARLRTQQAAEQHAPRGERLAVGGRVRLARRLEFCLEAKVAGEDCHVHLGWRVLGLKPLRER